MHQQVEHAVESTDSGSVELELGDGSRLVLDRAQGSPIVCRIEGDQQVISLDDAMRLSGQPFAGYRLQSGRSRTV